MSEELQEVLPTKPWWMPNEEDILAWFGENYLDFRCEINGHDIDEYSDLWVLYLDDLRKSADIAEMAAHINNWKIFKDAQKAISQVEEKFDLVKSLANKLYNAKELRNNGGIPDPVEWDPEDFLLSSILIPMFNMHLILMANKFDVPIGVVFFQLVNGMTREYAKKEQI